VFLPGSDLMRQILTKARSSEFVAAAFIFADDDLLYDGQTQPRGNVLIEYGAFAAALGEENTIVFRVGNPKVPSDLRGMVYIDLNKKYKAKGHLVPWAEKIKAKQKRNMGKLFETYVDAALCTETTTMARAEILKCAHEQTPIPGKYLYDSEVGADHWISLCEDPTYGFFQKGLRFWENEAPNFVQAIKERTGPEFDFISLGPGDGQKDLELIRAWDQDEDLDVVYYPYDVSLRMIIETVRQIRKSAVPIKLRAVLAEFDNLQQMKAVFDARDAPNVISLLGNSLGNVRDELTFLKNLSSIMNVGDLLLLEVPSAWRQSRSLRAQQSQGEGVLLQPSQALPCAPLGQKEAEKPTHRRPVQQDRWRPEHADLLRGLRVRRRALLRNAASLHQRVRPWVVPKRDRGEDVVRVRAADAGRGAEFPGLLDAAHEEQRPQPESEVLTTR
jgi:hypothetical protein